MLTHFTGLDLLVLIVAGVIFAVLMRALVRLERTELTADCDTDRCPNVATVAMERHTGQITWRCQRCADEMYARGWAQ